MENEKYTKIIEEANNILKQGKITITRLYETLVAKGVLEPDSKKSFEKLLEYAIETKLISKGRLKRYKSKKNQLPEAFTTEQLINLFDVIDRPKLAIACALTFFCGLRISEVCNLEINDMDLKNLKLKVTDGKNSRRFETGYGKDRIVPIPYQMRSPIKKWIEIINGGKWFLPSHNSPDNHIRPKTLHGEFKWALKRAGLLISKYTVCFKQKIGGRTRERTTTRHKYYFHTLRHSYATYLRSKGIDIQTISELLGHNQITTTQIYAKMTDVQRQKSVNEAFSSPLQNPAPMPVIKSAITNPSNLKPVEFLQMQMLNGEITQEEYVNKLALLNPEGIKKIIEIKE